jgi:predicted phage terminase large subunit-like protein
VAAINEYAIAERQFGVRTVDAPRQWPTPLDLAEAINPFPTVRTPALELINAEVVRALTEPDGRLIISTPPQEGKTSAVTIPAALWMLVRDPALRIAIACYDNDLSEQFGGRVRELIENNSGADGTLDLGIRVSRASWAKRRWTIEGNIGGLRTSSMASGKLTGNPVDVLFLDDPYGRQEDADSPAFRESVWHFWTGTALPRLAPGSPVILIQTRWHEDDLAGRLQAGPDGKQWTVINIPAQADHNPSKGEVDPLGRAPGEWLRSVRGRTEADWELRRLSSPARTWTSMYQGRPSPESGNVWLRPWWGRRYHELPWTIDGNGAYRVDGFDEVAQSWDLAFKDTKGSDFVVGAVLARRKAEVYVLDLICRRMSFTDTVTAFRAMTAKWPQAAAKYVEEAANGAAVIDTLRQEIGGIVPVKPEGSKYARANAVAPFIAAGNVLLPADGIEIPGFDVEAFIDEAAAFPNGAHDDQVDAVSQGLKKLLIDGSGAAEWSAYLRQLAAANAEAAAAERAVPDEPEPADDTERMRAARQAAFHANRPDDRRSA